jgi:hypothetical protein
MYVRIFSRISLNLQDSINYYYYYYYYYYCCCCCTNKRNKQQRLSERRTINRCTFLWRHCVVYITKTNFAKHSPSEAYSRTAGQQFPAFYETRMFITVFTAAHNRCQHWPRWIQSTPSHPILKTRFNTISHLRLDLQLVSFLEVL